MRIVIQRVSHASVTIEGHCKSSIGKGMLILVGIEEADGQEDIDWLCKKISSCPSASSIPTNISIRKISTGSARRL